MAPALAYCTNLFPSESVADVKEAVGKLASALAPVTSGPIRLGLYVSARAAHELESEAAMVEFESFLTSRNVEVVTVNAFPYGGFHDPVVREGVFRPTWEEAERREYTLRACRHLARWLPMGLTGSVSTHSGCFKDPGAHADSDERIRRAWLRMAVDLEQIEEETGRHVVLAIEPEPLSRLETTEDVCIEFEKILTTTLRRSAAEWSVHGAWLERVARRHLGVCFDVCHQAVEFEDGERALARLRAAGIAIGKIQASSAPALANPAASATGLEALGRLAEPRYLHQTFGRRADGTVLRHKDLTEALSDRAFLAECREIRTHFHVPVHLESLGHGLGTTRSELIRVLTKCGDATPCVEIETYTLPALEATPPRLLATIAEEWRFVRGVLSP